MNFRRLPKIDLHLHLDGAIRTRTIAALADEQGVRLPKPLERHVTVGRSCRSLQDFLRCFDNFLPVLRTARAIERVAYELCEDCAADGVIYFEARYAPHLQNGDTFRLEESVQGALEGLRRGRRDFGVENNLLLCFLRPDPAHSMRTAKAAVKFGAAGVDLAGDERAPAAPHEPAFRHARKHDLPITVHCGEAGPAANVAEAVDRIGARRVGHAVRAADDPRLLERLVQRGVTVEASLTSNLQTRAVRSLRFHPLPLFRRAGVRVTLNTDDPRVSRTTLSREYTLAARAFGFGLEDFRELLGFAVDAAFCSESLRRRLRRALDAPPLFSAKNGNPARPARV